MSQKRVFPILSWLPGYKREWLSGDISAGLTVGVMLIPQGMAYAMIAGVPPIYGLYASTFPLIIYALFGTSRQLAVGPVAIDSLLVLAGVSAFAEVGSEYFVELAILLAFIEGLILILFGFLRLGFLVNFLSKPVIGGFTAAAAIIIGVSQLRHLLGIQVQSSGNVFETLFLSFSEFSNWSVLSLVIGLLGIALILSVKRINRKIPGALTAVVVSILAVYFLNLSSESIRIVGDIPAGLPAFRLPNFNLEIMKKLLPAAFTIGLIAFTEAISISKAIQAKHRDYEIFPNQELFAIGIANIVGSMFQSFSVTGGLGRTAVNDQAGAKTGLASLISAALVMLTLLFLTPLFYYLPQAILASIIMVAVSGLIDIKYGKHLWNTDRREFIMLISTFLATLVFGIVNGILIGVLLSIGLVIFRVSKPHFAKLGRIKGTNYYRNVLRFNEAEEFEELLIVRFDAQLFFANCEFFKDSVLDWAEKKPKLKTVLIDAQPLNQIDSTASYMLLDLIKHFNDNGVEVIFAGVKGPVRDKFRKAKIATALGSNHFYMNVHEAVSHHLKEGGLPPEKLVTQSNEQ
ncbi:MAG: solute carrier family 26 protein [Salibacteraceae bacterium]|nr:solute carrier family 26 protein [Salibacteraceae bacterium]|tara:strand:- start:51106 stop:52824 length:1719 start_codon:yes stop_codon:yes gene_type:complete